MATGTVAVLGGGVDDIYPPEHAALYDRLVAQGCVVSESAPGLKAHARDFPRRSAIQTAKEVKKGRHARFPESQQPFAFATG